MKMLGWIIMLALVLLALFAAANWPLLTETATLNFLVFTVQGPLGVILLGATVAFIALLAVYVLSLRTSALVETRRHTQALETQRELADTAEASRFTALGAQLEQEFATLRVTIAESRAEAQQRADALDEAIRHSLNETANELSANIGQVDDKLDRVLAKS